MIEILSTNESNVSLLKHSKRNFNDNFNSQNADNSSDEGRINSAMDSNSIENDLNRA